MAFKKILLLLHCSMVYCSYQSNSVFHSLFDAFVKANIDPKQYALFNDLVQMTQERSYIWGRKALVFQVPEKTRIAIVSNIRGDFRSLAAIMNNMKAQKILSDDLILDVNTYLIFDGNMIGKMSENQKVIETILNVMKKNPEHTWYIRGFNEDKEHWVDFPLGKMVQELDRKNDVHKVVVRNFFNTRPLALYFYVNGLYPLRISYFGHDLEDFHHLYCIPLHRFAALKSICESGGLCTYNEGRLGASIIGDQKSINWSAFKGLQFVKNEKAWHIFSSPVQEFKQKYGYFYDAYAVVTCANSLETSTITLYGNDIRQKKGFTTIGTYNLVSGKKVLI